MIGRVGPPAVTFAVASGIGPTLIAGAFAEGTAAAVVAAAVVAAVDWPSSIGFAGTVFAAVLPCWTSYVTRDVAYCFAALPTGQHEMLVAVVVLDFG